MWQKAMHYSLKDDAYSQSNQNSIRPVRFRVGHARKMSGSKPSEVNMLQGLLFSQQDMVYFHKWQKDYDKILVKEVETIIYIYTEVNFLFIIIILLKTVNYIFQCSQSSIQSSWWNWMAMRSQFTATTSNSNQLTDQQENSKEVYR